MSVSYGDIGSNRCRKCLQVFTLCGGLPGVILPSVYHTPRHDKTLQQAIILSVTVAKILQGSAEWK